ncbi:MAG: MBL fold metallo-hydrolase [Acholeplasmatales bacterium]|nr:MBL fold metallo-hydrolase [Acholeplasmatales bacterium]
MKKTFITKIPDKPGSFLKPTKIISNLGLNITRVSYNNAIDTNILFIEVEGSEVVINKAYEVLKQDNFLFKEDKSNVILMEFKLLDKPNSLLPILEIISEFNFNISYISSQENNTDYQYFKMALFIDDPSKVDSFLKRVTKYCSVRIITYDKTEKNLDNTVFYISFAHELATKLDLEKNKINDLIENSNLVMQLLEDDSNPHMTFEYIAKFGDLLNNYRGFNFNPRIKVKELKDYTLYSIEPPCGSNIYIIKKDNDLIFVDSGFRTYIKEMKNVLRYLIPNFDTYKRSLIITHPDIDHCGLVEMFDKIYVSKDCYENFKNELNNKPNFREAYKPHEPYVKISKILSNYIPPKLESLIVVDNEAKNPFDYIGSVNISNLEFKFYLGNNGHSKGEVFITLDSIYFTGDILVNPKGYTDEQKAFNVLAPYLMTSVNMDSIKAKEERLKLEVMIKDTDIICYGHGEPRL